ncbi:MAG TPA: type II secretion system protein M [Alcanivoracaceae bacterium]|nr:type II secretion system protein M [Alcanivoracaceae bacterium]
MRLLQPYQDKIRATLAPYINKYQQLEARERLALTVLAAVLCLCVAYWLVWSPLNAKHNAAKNNYLAQQRILTWMQDHEGVIKQSRSSAAGAGILKDSHKDVLSIANSTSAQQGVQLRSFSPSGANKLSFQLEQQEFVAVMKWLYELESTYGIEVASIDISNTANPGKVNVRANIERKR